MKKIQSDEQVPSEQDLAGDTQNPAETLEQKRNEVRARCEINRNRVISELTDAVFSLTDSIKEDENELAGNYARTFGDNSYSEPLPDAPRDAYKKGEEYFSAKQLAAFRLDDEAAVQVFDELQKEMSEKFLSKVFDGAAEATDARNALSKSINQTFEHLVERITTIGETRRAYIKAGVDALPSSAANSWEAQKAENFTRDAINAATRMGNREAAFLENLVYWNGALIKTAVEPYVDTFIPQEK